MEIDVNNGAFQVVMESVDLNVVVGESARIDVGEAINYIKSGQAEIEEAVIAGKNAFNANATAKTNAFNQNATDKTTAFNNNATSKTNDFNDNYTAKKALIDAQVSVAEGAATTAKQYAIGDPSEPTGNSAKYWAEQAASELSGLTSRVSTIEGKIPSAASASNQLADKDYVSSVLPTVNNATLTIQKNGTDVQTFTANASTNVTANITVPTQPSDIGAQDALVSGTNIKTINNNSILGSGNLDINGLPTQTGQSGKFLTTDGTDASWANVDALPSQTGQSGKYLTTDGSSASWATVSTTPSIDNKSITTNGSSQLQTIGVINQNDTTTALKSWSGTKAQYDAIVTKDANTLYNITDDTDVSLTILEALYPVGSIYITTANTCPLSALISGSTWVLVGQDRVLQGAGLRGVVGTTLNESLPNIKGTTRIVHDQGISDNAYEQGVFYQGNSIGAGIPTRYSGATGYELGFNASLSSSTYQDNAPVQPDAYLVNIFRRTA